MTKGLNMNKQIIISGTDPKNYNFQKFGKFCRENGCLIITKELCQKNEPLLILDSLLLHFEIDRKLNGLKCSETIARSVIYNFYISGFFDKDILLDIIRKLVVNYNIGLNDRLQRKKKHTRLDFASESVIAHLPAEKFYKSSEWRSMRYMALKHHGNNCMACGRSPKDGVIIHVDHIKPRSVYPELSLDFSNLQVLCEECNLGKSNRSTEDWR
jgi:hypothetical protein